MTDQTDAPTGGAEGAIAPEASEDLSATLTEQTTGADEAGQADDAGEATEAPKRVPWFQKRINEVTAQRYEAERQAAYWRGKAEAGPQSQAPSQPAVEKPPTREQFDYDEDAYVAAIVEYTRKETERSLEARLSEREQKRTEQQKNDDAIAKLKAGGEKFPDFLAAVGGITATEAVRDFALADPNAAAVLYELGKDVAAAERFNSLSPVQQAIELGKRAATPKATTRTIPPPPPETVSGVIAGIGKTPDQMSMAEYVAWQKERDKT